MFPNDWAVCWYHDVGVNKYRVVIMTHQTLSLEKYWKLFSATLSHVHQYNIILELMPDTYSKLSWWQPWNVWNSLFHTFHNIYSSLKTIIVASCLQEINKQYYLGTTSDTCTCCKHFIPAALLNQNSFCDSPGIYELLCFNQFHTIYSI